MIANAQYLMHGIIKKTADARGPNPRRLGFEIKDLAYQPRLPEQTRIKGCTVLFQAGIKFRQHAQCKSAIRSDVLVTTDRARRCAEIPLLQ